MTDPQPPERRHTRWRTEAQWQQLQKRIRNAATNSDPGGSFEIDPGRPRQWGTYLGAVAACAIFAFFLVSRGSAPNAPLQWQQASTGPAQHDSLRFSDGTLVMLGPSTTVRYAVNSSHREVQLKGVAGFEVTHDASRPFRVHAGNAIALDEGTRFVVRHYESDTTVDVSVSEGVVALSDTTNTARVTLRAGTAGQVAQNGTTSLNENPRTDGNELWLRGQLQFNDATLAAAAREISNWFGVRVTVPESALARRHVTAVYTNASLEGVLDALAATLDLSYTRQDSVVILRSRVRHE